MPIYRKLVWMYWLSDLWEFYYVLALVLVVVVDLFALGPRALHFYRPDALRMLDIAPNILSTRCLLIIRGIYVSDLLCRVVLRCTCLSSSRCNHVGQISGKLNIPGDVKRGHEFIHLGVFLEVSLGVQLLLSLQLVDRLLFYYFERGCCDFTIILYNWFPILQVSYFLQNPSYYNLQVLKILHDCVSLLAGIGLR